MQKEVLTHGAVGGRFLEPLRAVAINSTLENICEGDASHIF